MRLGLYSCIRTRNTLRGTGVPILLSKKLFKLKKELALDTLERMRAETALPYDFGPILRSGDIVPGPELLAHFSPLFILPRSCHLKSWTTQVWFIVYEYARHSCIQFLRRSCHLKSCTTQDQLSLFRWRRTR